mgnify:CR=1 FL=1
MSEQRRLSPAIACPCDGSFLEQTFTYTAPPEGETNFDWTGQDYARRYDRCRACGHWFGAHELDLTDLYSGNYVASTYGNRLAVTFERILALPSQSSDNLGRRERLLAFAAEQPAFPSFPSLLDVGSGLGVFPYVMKEVGWNCTALDPDPDACTHIADRVGVPTISADFMDLQLSELGTYDVVTLNKVVEHVEDACRFLRKAAELTSPRGFVYLEVPDGDGAASSGPEREEFFVEHHHAFSMASLSATVERANLQVIRVDRLVEPSGKFTLACFAVPRKSCLEGCYGD